MDTWINFLEDTGPKSVASLPEVQNIIRVPQIRQTDGYCCGVACLQSILYFYGIALEYAFIKKAVKATPANGTDHRDIIQFVQSLGHTVELKKGMTTADLEKLIDQGKPVLLVIQAWAESPEKLVSGWDSGHYVVGIGYDVNNFYLMDPSTLGNYAYIPREEFVSRWHDKDGDIKLVHAGIVISGNKYYDPDQMKKLQ